MWICVWTDIVVFVAFLVWWFVCRVNRRQIEVCFSPDVIHCGWLGSKYQLTLSVPIISKIVPCWRYGTSLSLHDPQGEAGDVWMSPPCLESQAVIWFHSSSSSLFLLSSPATLSVWSFVSLLVHSAELLPENSTIFCVKRVFFFFFWYDSCLAARRSKFAGGMCSMLLCGTGIRCDAFKIASVHSFFFLF